MVLRNVPKTFTFEEQRIEINEIAQDLHNLATQELNDIELTSFQVSVQAAGSANLVYDNSTGVFSYTPPDLSLYLTSETDPVFTSHPSFSINTQNINDWTAATVLVNNNHGTWTTAYSWGDHGIVGYLTSNVISTSDTPPASPADGTLWWNSDDGQLKVYYDDGDSSQWVDARTTLPGVELINDLSDVDSSSPSNGDILKWVDANGKWEPAAETAFTGITYTDLSVGTPNTPSLLGAISYDNAGTFTYTPPDLSAYWITNNAKIINWDTAFNWGNHGAQGYLTGIGSLSVGALLDVDTTTTAPNAGEGLVWDNVSNKWIPGVVGGSGAGLDQAQVRSSISVIKPNPTASGSGDVTYNNTNGEFTYTPPNLQPYLTSYTETDPVFSASDASNVTNAKIADWDTAYGWGDHGAAGYLTSLGDAAGVTAAKITNWDTAYGWGDHSAALIYSDYVSASAGYAHPAVNAFDGSTSTRCEPFDDSTVIVDFTSFPGGGITVNSSLRIYLTKSGSPAASHLTVNGINLGGSVPSGDWLTVSTNGKLETITFYHDSGNSSVELFAVEVDGNILTDSVGYLTSLGDAAGVTSAKITNWDTAYGWGDHSAAGYLTSVPSSVLDDYIKRIDTTYTSVERSGASSYFQILTESFFKVDADAQVTIDAVGQIQLKSDSYIETQSTRFEVKNAADDETLFQAVAGGACQLYYNNTLSLITQDGGVKVMGFLKDKNDSQGIAGEILSSTGSELEWIAAPTAGSSFDSGTRMLFQQSSAPTDWVKDTSSNNNSALRIVTGNASTGGNVDFTTVFTNSRTPSGSVTVSVHGRTLSTNQMPSHNHFAYTNDLALLADGGTRYLGDSNGGGTGNTNTGNRGGSQSHDHGSSGSFSGNAMDFNVKYTDVIVAIKS